MRGPGGFYLILFFALFLVQSVAFGSATPCEPLLTAKLKERYAAVEYGAYWSHWRDGTTEHRRFIEKRDYDAHVGSQHPTEIYGTKTYLAWAEADEYLRNIPKGRLKLSLELFKKVHQLANKEDWTWTKKFLSFLPSGLVPTNDGEWKTRASLGKRALFHPLTNEELALLRDNPWLEGFWELPWPLSGTDSRRGVIVYAKPKEVEAKLTKLIEWYEANKAALDPIALAAQFSRAYVSIHPHIDGNGRTSRLLMDRILAEHGLPPPLLEDHDHDILLSPEQYTQRVSEGVKTWLDIYDAEYKKGDFNHSPDIALGMFGRNILFGLPRVGKGQAPIPPGMSKTWSESETILGGERFLFLADGFFHTSQGIPYVYHDGELWPVADKTYQLYFEGGAPREVAPYQKKLTLAHRDVYRAHFELMNGIRDKTLKPEEIHVRAYSEIEEANKHERYLFYPWQRDVFANAVEIRDTDPVLVLIRSRHMNTDFENSFSRSPPHRTPPQESPGLVLAQYEAMDFKFHEYLDFAKKEAPEHVKTVLESRRKLHEAARTLLAPFLRERGYAAGNQLDVLGRYPAWRIWEAWFEHSKLKYETFDEAIHAVDDNVVYLLRADSNAAHRLGFRSEADYRRLFDRLPGSFQTRLFVKRVNKYLSDPKNTETIRAKIKKWQGRINEHAILLLALPESLREMALNLEKTYSKLKTFVIPRLANHFFSNTFEYRGTSVEAQRAFVDFSIHATGGPGLKEGTSFTSNINLLVATSSNGLPFTDANSDPALFLVAVPRDKVTWDFASDFASEYEFLLLEPLGPNSILKSFKAKEVNTPIPDDAPDTLVAFARKYNFGPLRPKTLDPEKGDNK